MRPDSSFFKDGSYVRHDWAGDQFDDGCPRPISAWNLSDGSGKHRGKARFFKGRRYARHDRAANAADPGFPADIAAWGLPGRGLAWGKRVSADFKVKVAAVADTLGCDPNHLMAAPWRSNRETFSPLIVNHVSSAAGLIRFMPATAKSLGTTTPELAAMSAERQLDDVARYFGPYKAGSSPRRMFTWSSCGQGRSDKARTTCRLLP